MKLFTCLFISLALLLGFSAADAAMQAEENNNDSSKNDMSDFDNWDIVTDSLNVSFSNPTIDVQWGILTNVEVSDVSLLDIGSADIRIGFTDKKSDSHNENILDYSHNFMYLSNSSNSWMSQANATNDPRVETKAWSFGFGTSGGYGYKLGGDADLSLYHMVGIGWTKTEFKDSTIDRAANDLIRTLGDNFRFGTRFEAGMKLQVFKPIALNVAYERSIVFPRHMFWYWAASEITEGVGQVFLSEFSDAVMDRSPYVGPIVHFVLKNALSYGFYELRRKHMNWPVQTVAPLMYENYKVGLTFAF